MIHGFETAVRPKKRKMDRVRFSFFIVFIIDARALRHSTANNLQPHM